MGDSSRDLPLPLGDRPQGYQPYHTLPDLPDLEVAQQGKDAWSEAVKENPGAWYNLFAHVVGNLRAMEDHSTKQVFDFNTRLDLNNEIVEDLNRQHTAEVTRLSSLTSHPKKERSSKHPDPDKFDGTKREELRSFLFNCRIKLDRNRDHFVGDTEEETLRSMTYYLHSRLSGSAADQALPIIEGGSSTHGIGVIDTPEQFFVWMQETFDDLD
ncbi:MAG: hypothetical protein Q9191_008273, partial [Dirinaria sp. TL-2023a]